MSPGGVLFIVLLLWSTVTGEEMNATNEKALPDINYLDVNSTILVLTYLM